MIKKVLQLLLGEGPLFRILLVVLDVSRGVPREKHLCRVGAETLLAHPVPAVVRVRDVRAEQSQTALITTHRRLPAALDPAQISENSSTIAGVHDQGNSLLCAMKRRTRAIRLSMVSWSRLRHSCWLRHPSSISSTVWASGCSSGTEPTRNTRPLLSTGKPSLQAVSSDASLNHLMNRYHISAGRSIVKQRFLSSVSRRPSGKGLRVLGAVDRKPLPYGPFSRVWPSRTQAAGEGPISGTVIHRMKTEDFN